MDETRAIRNAVVKLPGVMVEFVRQPVHAGGPSTSRIRIDMLDQRAADTAATPSLVNQFVQLQRHRSRCNRGPFG